MNEYSGDVVWATRHTEILEGKVPRAYKVAEQNLAAYMLMPDKVNPNKGILITAENQYSDSQKKEAIRNGRQRKTLAASSLPFHSFIHEQAYDTETFQEQRTQAHSFQACVAGGNERGRQVDARRNRATQSGCGRGRQDWRGTLSRENGETEGINGVPNEPLHSLERSYTAGDFAKAKARSNGMGHDIDGQPDRDFRKAFSGEPSPRYERAHSSKLGSKQETVPAHEGILKDVADTRIHYDGAIKTLAASPSSLYSSNIAAIDYDNMARMLEYQLGRANVLLAGSGWELKGYNPNQPRGKSSAASNSGSFISRGGWPSDFPTIKPMTSGPALTSHPAHKAGKEGDVDAANNVVYDLADRKKLPNWAGSILKPFLFLFIARKR